MAKRRAAAQIQAVLAVERHRAKGLAVADSCRRHGITEQSYYGSRPESLDGAIPADRAERGGGVGGGGGSTRGWRRPVGE